MNPYESPELLQELFQYSPDTGRLTHRTTRGVAKAGTPADTTRSQGYRCVNVTVAGKQRHPMAHRVAWILYHGKPIPDGLYIDHASGNKQDNRISNLRLVTNQENHHNRRTAKGYTWNAQRQKWLAQITVGGKKINLGRHTTELDARAEYLRAKRQYHPTAPIH